MRGRRAGRGCIDGATAQRCGKCHKSIERSRHTFPTGFSRFTHTARFSGAYCPAKSNPAQSSSVPPGLLHCKTLNLPRQCNTAIHTFKLYGESSGTIDDFYSSPGGSHLLPRGTARCKLLLAAVE